MASAAELYLKSQEPVQGPDHLFPPDNLEERRATVQIKAQELRLKNFGRAILPIFVILAAVVAAAVVAFVLSNPFALAIIGLVAAGFFLFLLASHAKHTYSIIQLEREADRSAYPTWGSKIGKFFSEIGETG